MIYRKQETVKPREGSPRVIACMLRTDTDHLTFADDAESPAHGGNTRIRYAIVGTNYGWLHNAAGDIRFFNSRSGARDCLKHFYFGLPRFRHYEGVRYVASVRPGNAPAGFAHCMTCWRAWDDEKSTGLTPTPAGRCPFEHWHK